MGRFLIVGERKPRDIESILTNDEPCGENNGDDQYNLMTNKNITNKLLTIPLHVVLW